MEPFDTRLLALQARLENWWEFGDQEVPCVLFTSGPSDPLSIPTTDDLGTWWTDVDFIIERQMKQLEAQTFYGQSVPCHYVNLGSCAMAGILGARMEYLDKRTVWAHPTLRSIEQILDVAVDRDSLFYRVLRRCRSSQ